MLIEIKHRYTNNVLYACEAENMREAVLLAIKNKANLSSADLRWADLSSADLRWADLSSADLSSADLRWADLRSADLSSADLSWADLRWADLSSADLRWAKNTIVSQGDIIGWKSLKDGKIAQLLIPANAKRVNSIGSRKCRAEFAEVVAIFKGNRKIKYGLDNHTGLLKYEVGKKVIPDSFNDDIYTECTNGIHFFITREEAENYD
jgi:Family of unknown function (DUF5758)/Pentapeptide repeats (8 copies)